MKYTLMLLLCSMVQNDCLQPYEWPENFDSIYDCMIAGYEESINKMQEIGRHDVNNHQLFIRFTCSPTATI